MDNERPLVSIIMSTYNAEQYLAECLASIEQQTFKDYEVLIIDDSSTDGTVSVIRRWCARDSRFRLIGVSKTNRGLTCNLNELLRQAHSPFICRMDADDVACAERLEKQVDYLCYHPDVDVVGTWAYEIDNNGTFLRIRKVPLSEKEIRRLIPLANPMIHSAVLFRREAIMSINGYDERYRTSQDYDLWFRCLAAGLKLANIGEPMIKYRVASNHVQKRGIKYRKNEALIRWRGLGLLNYSLFHRLVYSSIPIILGIMPNKIKELALRFNEFIDPRQKIKLHKE